MINFKYTVFLFSAFNILTAEVMYRVKFKYNDQPVYEREGENKSALIDVEREYKTGKVEIRELIKTCVDAVNSCPINSCKETGRENITYADTTLLYVKNDNIRNGDDIIARPEKDDGEVVLTPNTTLTCCFFSKSIINSIRQIKISKITINKEDINASFALTDLPRGVFQDNVINWNSSIINYIVDSSEDIKNFVNKKNYAERRDYGLYDSETRIGYGGLSLIDNASELKESEDIWLSLDYKWVMNIDVEYTPERDDLQLREHIEDDEYMFFDENDGYGESFQMPKRIEYYYNEHSTPNDKEKKVREAFSFRNEYEHDYNIYDCYDSKEVKKQKVKNNKNRIQLFPKGTTWDNLGNPGTYVKYILSERSEAVKTKIIPLYTRKDGKKLSEETEWRPIIIVLDGDKCTKEELERKLKEKTFANGVKLSKETINRLLNSNPDLKDGAIYDLEVNEKEGNKLLNIYMNNKLEENEENEENREDERENNEENKKNDKKVKKRPKINGPNVPNSKCCGCCSGCCKCR